MQLTCTSSILAMAAASVLGLNTAAAVEWENEASVLYYGEDADRVQDLSAKYSGTRTADNGDRIGLNLGVDTLSGSSPSGITTSHEAQTISSPSGESQVTHPAGTLPLDDSFQDARFSASASWNRAVNESTGSTLGASFSKESDYLHLGVNASVSRTLNEKNTTLLGGVAFSNDTVEAVGGIPTVLLDSEDKQVAGNRETKAVVDLMLGVTHILSKRTIAQFNYSFSQAEGYLNDPYKYVSQVNAQGLITSNLYESRPDSRTGHNLYGALKWKIGDSLISSTGLRYHTDDWGINSFTIDQKWRFSFGSQRSIEPHIRLYSQTAADFYHVQLNSADALPTDATADYRLAEFQAYTVGATYRWQTAKNRQWRIVSEYYQQNPIKQTLTEAQAGLDSSAGFSALMLSFGVRF